MADFEIVGYIDGVPIKRYKSSARGPKPPRRKKGKRTKQQTRDHNPNRPTFKKVWPKVKSKMPHLKGGVTRDSLKTVNKGARLEYLKQASIITNRQWRSADQLAKLRKEFNRTKETLLPLYHNTRCLTCISIATLRHHIVPLAAQHGTNKAQNIVPLCVACHRLIHPFLPKGPSAPKETALEQLQSVFSTMQPIVPEFINDEPEQGLRGTVA